MGQLDDPAIEGRELSAVVPGERHRDVHVQEADHPSYIAASTILGVSKGAPSRTWKTGTSPL